MLDDILWGCWQLHLLLPTVLVATEPEKKNRLELASTNSDVPNIRNPHKWLRAVYCGEQRAWSPPGKRAARAQPWLEYVDTKLKLVY